MCSIHIQRTCHNLNRGLIVALSMTGLILDSGYTLANAIIGISILIWVWLPEWDRLLILIFDQLSSSS